MGMTQAIEGQFDYIVVGGGSAGCIMASRLSENQSNKVLLIESGPDFAPGFEPKAMSDPAAPIFFHPQYFHPMTGEGAASLDGREKHEVVIAQARVMGGGSSVNGMHAQRGEPSDFDEWSQLGVRQWGWDDVLPYFKRVETDLEFNNDAHGTTGPIKITRHGKASWSNLSVGVARLLERQGIPFVSDLNDHEGDGYGPVPLSASDHRMSTATAYLTNEVRNRKNLSILPDTRVRRVRFDGRQACGVELWDQGRTGIAGANVIVSCGTMLSPELLLRSGVGPAKTLADLGIKVIANRPGVGQNLQSHAQINLFTHLTRRGRSNGKARAPCLMVARLSSGLASCPPSDLIFNLWERTPGSTVENRLHRQFGDFMLILNKAYSYGSVTLDAADVEGPARVRTNLLSDSRDLDRMVAGFKRIALLATAPELSGLINDTFAMKPDPAALDMFQETLKARLMCMAGAVALDGPAFLRRKFLENAVNPVDDFVNDPSALEALVRRDCGPTHSGGTCRLGDADQIETVVDKECRVVGVDGVRVVDASIFPRLMRAGTNLPTMMAAEKTAESIRIGH